MAIETYQLWKLLCFSRILVELSSVLLLKICLVLLEIVFIHWRYGIPFYSFIFQMPTVWNGQGWVMARARNWELSAGSPACVAGTQLFEPSALPLGLVSVRSWS